MWCGPTTNRANGKWRVTIAFKPSERVNAMPPTVHICQHLIRTHIPAQPIKSDVSPAQLAKNYAWSYPLPRSRRCYPKLFSLIDPTCALSHSSGQAHLRCFMYTSTVPQLFCEATSEFRYTASLYAIYFCRAMALTATVKMFHLLY